jgi:uncharacterized protein YaaW (UPF0174 family)
MAQLPLIEEDSDLLPPLRRATNEALDPLVGYITDNGQGRMASQLDSTTIYVENSPNHSAYADEIAAEIQKFGGNTIANIFRGGKGVLYGEIVRDVARRLKVNFNDSMDVASIEFQILLKVLARAWENMTDDQRREFLTELGIDSSTIPNALPIMAVQTAIRTSGFLAYQIAVIVANAVAKAILGRGLPLVANQALTKMMSILAGPIGWAITILWTIIDLAGPAYRVTIPCVIQVAFIRQQSMITRCPNGHKNTHAARFCSECGAPLNQS